MAETATDLRLSYAEYLAMETASEVRHEYVAGMLYAMSGGKPVHARLAAAVIHALSASLAGSPCATYTSDLRVYIPADGRSTYPDITVICGPVEHADADPDAAINPTVIVEVLSDSTEGYDRGEKFAAYRLLPSLQDYLLVRPDAAVIEHFRRSNDAEWVLRAAGAGEHVQLSMGAGVAVDDVYAGVELLEKRARARA